MSTEPREHSLICLVKADDDGTQWWGVGVCTDCQPDEEVRRTFTHGDPCPDCGGAGTLEWRLTDHDIALEPGSTTKIKFRASYT